MVKYKEEFEFWNKAFDGDMKPLAHAFAAVSTSVNAVVNLGSAVVNKVSSNKVDQQQMQDQDNDNSLT